MTDSLTGAAAPVAIAWPDPERESAFEHWFRSIAARHGLDRATLRPASADASARRYFRVDSAPGVADRPPGPQQGATGHAAARRPGESPGSAARSFIVMDSPSAEDGTTAFIHIAGLFQDAGLHGPRVLEQDAARGFLLLDDLGDTPYLTALRDAAPATADTLMRDAIAALVQWQLRVDARDLPPYDDALLRRELQLFPDWCVQREFGVAWSERERTLWDELCARLVGSALAQPQVAVHRDWMPRNLMVCSRNPGVLDFQDAVRGPITYDLASLLRDAFISWDEERELDWAVRYWQQARSAGLPVDPDFGEFWRATEWMGLQRHLKVLGIFCRLKHRDGKPNYSTDLPRFFAYAGRVANRYAPLRPLLKLLEPLSGATVEAGFTF